MLRIFFWLFCIPLIYGAELKKFDVELSKFLDNVDQKLADHLSKQVEFEWYTDVHGNDNETAINELLLKADSTIQFILSIRPAIAKFKRLNIEDPKLKRRLNLIPNFGIGILARDDFQTMTSALMNMLNGSLKMDFQNTCVAGATDPLDNVESLKNCWLTTSELTKHSIYDDWKIWLELYKKTANLEGYTTTADYELKEFGIKAVEVLKLMERFLLELRPIFVQFQAHIRHKLRSKLGKELLPVNQPIPFHLYDTFVQSTWNTVETPYPETTDSNITLALIKRGLNNAKRTFLNVAEFYRSMGFPQLPHDFFMLNAQPAGLSGSCDHKVYNFFAQRPVQLTYCPKINAEQFLNMFEAVSDIYFYNSVQTLPLVYQQEPLGHFCEGIAKFFSLIANSAPNLEKLKLINEGQHNKEQQLNNLYKMGFRQLLPLPMMYIIQSYRANVIDSKPYSNKNCFYWQLVEEFLGVAPPLPRGNEDFDIADKLFIDHADELASGFMGIVLKFQLFKYFCEQTGKFIKDDPLHTLDMCDLTDQRTVGPIIIKAMSLGASVSYHDVLQQMTGETEFNTDGIIEYFKSLFEWLEEQNDNDGAEIGWDKVQMCT